MSDDQQTLTTEEQSFLFETVFSGLNDRRETLDRDLFALLARRLLDAGYTADQLEQYVTVVDEWRQLK